MRFILNRPILGSMRNRAARRHHRNRVKNRIRSVVLNVWRMDWGVWLEDWVNRYADNPATCSRKRCGHRPWRKMDGPPVKDLRRSPAPDGDEVPWWYEFPGETIPDHTWPENEVEIETMSWHIDLLWPDE